MAVHIILIVGTLASLRFVRAYVSVRVCCVGVNMQVCMRISDGARKGVV